MGRDELCYCLYCRNVSIEVHVTLSYLNLVVGRTGLGGEQRAQLHPAGGGPAVAAAAGHLGAAALCTHR